MRRIKHPGLRHWTAGAALFVVVVVLTVSAAVRLSAQSGPATRVSVNSAGIPANADSFFAALSADGRIVGFKSLATNLDNDLPDQTQFDVFVHDRETGETVRASLTSFGFVGNDNSFPPALNDDGTLVAFASEASNMVPDDRNGAADVFVRNLEASTTTAVSLTTNGTLPAAGGSRDLPPSMSGSGRWVVFETTAVLAPNDPNTNIADVYLRDREAGTTELISVRTITLDADPALAPAISRNGCVVAFVSPSDNLIPQGGDPNERLDVYVRDLCADPPTMELITRGFNGNPTTRDSQQSLFPPAITDDGELVAFESDAINLVPNDTNQVSDVFVYNRVSDRTERVSVNTYGEQGDRGSSAPAISGDGRYVVFVSNARNFVEGTLNTANVFVRDRGTDQTCQVSLGDGLGQTAGVSANPAISRDGRWIAFESTSNLAPGGSPGRRYIYVVENAEQNQLCPPTPTPTRTVRPPTPTPGPNDCCQCEREGDACEEPSDGRCPDDCSVVFQAACLGEPLNCATFTPTGGTPTPMPGENDCCDCPERPELCAEPADGSCPDDCSPIFDAACLGEPEGCVANTPTPTPGANDCCDCPERSELCTEPADGSCPEDCSPIFDAACLGEPEGCVANTPTITPTPTQTPGENDCCDCPERSELCTEPADGSCPEDCSPIFDAACLGEPQGCVANTPTVTPTVTPTPGENDCCDCPERSELCTEPADGSCPEDCSPIFDAACLGEPEGCVANTPTMPPSATPTRTGSPNSTPTNTRPPTQTPGDDDCCSCPADPDLCAEPAGGLCPTGCEPVFDAACLGAPQGCVANTPTRTPGGGTPTATRTGTPVNSGGGGGGGCGCETNPQPRNLGLLALRDLLALFGPMMLWRVARRKLRA